MEKWNLPQNLSEVVENHHSVQNSEKHKINCAIVHLADYMTQKFCIGEFFWDEGLELNEAIIKILNLGDLNYLDNFMTNYLSLFEEQLNNFKF